MHKAAVKIPRFILILLLFLLAACISPRMPCDEKIDDPKTYEDIILANPLIQQLNSELTLREVNISPCFVNNKVSVGILYELPASYSEYSITYSDYIFIAYSKDGTIGLPGGIRQPAAWESNAILDYFQQYIRELEDNPRVKEVITKTEPDPMNPVTPIFGDMNVLRRNNRVHYGIFGDIVTGYSLSNNLDWLEFPEIKLAHKAIEEELLVGRLASCSIGRSNMHSYTVANFHDSPTGPWYLTVALICDDGMKEAYVQINNDGSHERLQISYENKNR